MDSIHDAFRRAGLVRPQAGRMLSGVCAGLGRRFGLAPMPARLLFTILLLAIPGSHLLIYPALWVLMPDEATAPKPPWAPYVPPTPPTEH